MKNENEILNELRAQKAEYMREFHRRNPKWRCYDVWKLMRRRCYDSNCKNFPNYGGRGIKICDAWIDFDIFWKWAAEAGYGEKLQIDRIDCNGDYSPENCRWTTSRNNNRNRRNNKLDVEKVSKIRLLLSQGIRGAVIARQYSVHHSLIYRIKHKQQWL